MQVKRGIDKAVEALVAELAKKSTPVNSAKQIEQVGQRTAILLQADSEEFIFGVEGQLDSNFTVNIFGYVDAADNHETVYETIETLKTSIFEKLTTDITFNFLAEMSAIKNIDKIIFDQLGILTMDIVLFLNRSETIATEQGQFIAVGGQYITIGGQRIKIGTKVL